MIIPLAHHNFERKNICRWNCTPAKFLMLSILKSNLMKAPTLEVFLQEKPGNDFPWENSGKNLHRAASRGFFFRVTLPETNSSPMKIPIFPRKYHENGGFPMAMLVYRSVRTTQMCWRSCFFSSACKHVLHDCESWQHQKNGDCTQIV